MSNASSNQLPYYLAFARVKGIGPARMRLLTTHFGSIETAWNANLFELSSSGTLVYMPGGRVEARRRLVILEHDGRIVPWAEDRRSYSRLFAPSRDGRRVAIGGHERSQ